ncbi:MAG: TolC family protein [Cytophagales bacterium]|nr:TolC family protein [Cytophagales bacterium]
MRRFITILYLVFIIGAVASKAQDTLEIATAIQIGLENNFDIKISEGQKTIASNNNTIGNAGFLPTLDLSSAQRYTIENTTQVFVSGDEQNRDGAKSNNFSAGAVLNWTLFDGKTMFYTKDRLQELEKQGIAITESVIQNIVARIAKEFYTVALEQIRLELLQENIGLSEDRLEIAKNKYDFGKSSKMEFLQAQVDLNRDKSNHMIQQEKLASSKTALNELLGRDVTLDFYVFFDPELNKDLQYEELNANMESNNPELLANRYEMNASRLVEKELLGERIPELGVNLGYDYAKSESEAGFLLSRQSRGITYGVSATWNLFDGFNLNRRIQNAKISAQNTELDYKATKLSLEKELYSIFISYRNNIQLHSMEEQNKKVANENNEIAIERYRVGNTSPLELREAQINLLEANLRYLNAAYAIKTSEIDLLLLSGTLLK